MLRVCSSERPPGVRSSRSGPELVSEIIKKTKKIAKARSVRSLEKARLARDGEPCASRKKHGVFGSGHIEVFNVKLAYKSSII
jgi:hypothetical protein